MTFFAMEPQASAILRNADPLSSTLLRVYMGTPIPYTSHWSHTVSEMPFSER